MSEAVAPRRRASPPAGGPGLFGIRHFTRTRFAIAVVLALLSLGPLVYMVSLSFVPNSEMLGSTLTLIPAHPTVENYVLAWKQIDFGHLFLNSLGVAIVTVVLVVVISSLASYAFARFKFRFREALFYLFLASLAVPSLMLLIPQFLLLDRLHLTNSLEGLTLLYVSANLPFTIFFLRGFFEAIPSEYEEAFRLGGANSLQVLRRLIIPLALPAVAVVSMFTFNFAWDEFPIALTMLNNPSRFTLPIGLNTFIGAHTTAWGPFFAASVIATVPTLVVFILSLRWFRSGVSLGGLR